MNFKNHLSWFLRKMGLLYFADIIRFLFVKIQVYQKNKIFKDHHKEVKFPPDYLMYESFKLDYKNYWFGGKETAFWIWDLTKEWLKEHELLVLDWGCGPARVIRHWGDIENQKFKCFGSDVNEKSIEWGKNNLTSIQFLNQALTPPLKVDDNYFHLIYGISVLTHLSEDAHYQWIKELKRILKPQGILFLTTQGESFKKKLTEIEKIKFDRGEIIIRGSVQEGHRTYSSFQPPLFMRSLLLDFEVLNHISLININNSQDVWIVRKF